MKKVTIDEFDLLFQIALDLSSSLQSQDRYQRLVDAVRQALPADAVTLLRLQGEALHPLATHGLVPDALGRQFVVADHPRLAEVCRQPQPTRFPINSPLPDPFEGLVEGAPNLSDHIHACLGIPLRVQNQLVGTLTLDSLTSNAFDGISTSFLSALGALAGAALHTSEIMEALERSARNNGLVAQDLVHGILERRGGGLLGRSDRLQALREEISVFAQSDYPVLVTGETGTGKELVVRTLHAESWRSKKPLVYVNCAALPESVVESELFGHIKGAFTGASNERRGKFQVADGGCLFLDEIGELPLSIQPKLLRVLQTGEIQRVGSDRHLHVDVRVFSATNRELVREVQAGAFRADLLHRLDVCRIHTPRLTDMKDDIPLLAGSFCDQARRQLGLGPVRLHSDSPQALMAYAWPGNVRELENVISRAVLKAAKSSAKGEPVWIRPRHLGQDFVKTKSKADSEDRYSHQQLAAPDMKAIDGRPLSEQLVEFKRQVILAALKRNHGVWSQAAKELGLHRSNLHNLAARLGLK
ncbi:MAG: nitric oxide reductase transcriptional regulator NorR [Planctomycetes bacterium]|nr:nitric oxide reductase transcriptional regulator NorR [Planctomycetota bacterium]